MARRNTLSGRDYRITLRQYKGGSEKREKGPLRTPLPDRILANDIRAAGAVREAIGAETDMAADANMAWSVNQATEFVNATGGLGMLYLEQPVRDDDLAGMAAIAKGPVPIAADEGIHGFDSP